MSFQGKVVIVTGSSSGIGAECAILFAKEGASVVINGRNEAKLNKVSEACNKYGNMHLVLKKDVTVEDEAKDIIVETAKKFGRIDVLINNAGMGTSASIMSANVLAAYDETMNTNIRSVVHLTHLAAPHLIKTKGNIINISSICSQRVVPNIMPYCVSKAALDHFTKCAAKELAPKGVRVNSVNPGPVFTDIMENNGGTPEGYWEMLKEQTALKRISEVDEIAELVLFLASDKAKGVTGSLFLTDNGSLLC